MTYPHVLSEDDTLTCALQGQSLSRFGDGELNLALGGTCVSQRKTHPKMQAELVDILKTPVPGCLVCIPNVKTTVKQHNWAKYADPRTIRLYGQGIYGSAFITRPDSAPWIDNAAYWARVARLWADKDIVFVHGDERSLREPQLSAAKSIRHVTGPSKNAYAEIDRIEYDVIHAKADGPVIMCMGVTATILAWRLAKRGIHAIDLGHIGMFMRHAGSYMFKPEQLISKHYRELNQQMHDAPEGFGGSGHKWAKDVQELANEIRATSILDYGCGEGTLKQRLVDDGCTASIFEYDPAVKGKDALPKPAYLVVATDVLEHVEPQYVMNVLRHIKSLTVNRCYMIIATRPANKLLPNGENAHVTLHDPDWWVAQVQTAGFSSIRKVVNEGHSVRLWLSV